MTNKDKILQIALNEFTSRGYDAVGVQEIADKAGITKPTLYHYFKNKNGLLEAILKEYFSQFHVDLMKAARYEGDIKLSLTGIVKCYFDFASKYSMFFRLQMSMWFAPSDSNSFKIIIPYLDFQQKLIENVFTDAVKDHGNMRDRHQIYALTFIGMINTYIGISLNGYLSLDDELINKALHQFMHGIFS